MPKEDEQTSEGNKEPFAQLLEGDQGAALRQRAERLAEVMAETFGQTDAQLILSMAENLVKLRYTVQTNEHEGKTNG